MGKYWHLFEKYCKYHGLKLEKAILNTLQQNEVVKDRTKESIKELGVVGSFTLGCLKPFGLKQ